MKYFISAADNAAFLLGFPAEQTEQIVPAERALALADSASKLISIPALLKLKDTTAPHGIILKTKTVLLTPRINTELEIPQENIYPLPKSFAGFGFFIGVYFTENNIIYIVDSENVQ